ncbi:hypothetical protein RchiOBHm_Chr1g0356901 [Rosa chinensis]|uniref:Transcription factor WD40-like family n=1 Tax=Rosa chinensis TaxID=74649 RepID=A0A2P6SHR5_ROSCH|nr:hypothetical protein RchiOBHm_Chr1g0356901 [Rosa chinensis]
MVSYISQNWSVQHVVASKDGMYLAIADLHGLIMYNTIQEVVYLETLLRNRRFRAKFCYGYELLFYPRYHLDQSSLLCRK